MNTQQAAAAMKTLATKLERDQPRIVAKTGVYTISQGVSEGNYYVFERDVFMGMSKTLDEAVDIIALREGNMEITLESVDHGN